MEEHRYLSIEKIRNNSNWHISNEWLITLAAILILMVIGSIVTLVGLGLITSPWLAVPCLLLFIAVLVGSKVLYNEHLFKIKLSKLEYINNTANSYRTITQKTEEMQVKSREVLEDKEFVNLDDSVVGKPLPLVANITTNEYREPAETMNAQQAYWTGVSYFRAKQFDEAIPYFERAAEQPEQDGTHIFAYVSLIRYYEIFGVNNEKEEILSKLKASINQLIQLADNGSVEAQARLGYCYHRGIGVPKNEEKAFEYLHKATDQGNMTAQYELGIAYYRCNNSVEAGKAVEYFRLAADQGHEGAQYRMGCYYQDGETISQDISEAVKFFKKAFDQGNANGKNAIHDLIRGRVTGYVLL